MAVDRIPTNFACPACGHAVEARLVSSDAETRRPRIMFRSMPAMICPHCDQSPDPGSKKIHAGLSAPPTGP